MTQKCSSVKEDHIRNDEEKYNDCTGGVSNKLMHEASSDQVMHSMNYLVHIEVELLVNYIAIISQQFLNSFHIVIPFCLSFHIHYLLLFYILSNLSYETL